jgi:hypothetical protein
MDIFSYYYIFVSYLHNEYADYRKFRNTDRQNQDS